MKKLRAWALPVSLIAAAVLWTPGNYWWESWAVKWCSLLVVLTIWISLTISKRIHPLLAIAFAWTMGCGIYTFGTVRSPYPQPELIDLLAYGDAVKYGTLCFLMLSVFFLLHLDQLASMIRAMAHLCWVNLIITWVQYFIYGHHRLALGGVFGNSSVNLSFQVAIVPLFLLVIGRGHGLWRALAAWAVVLGTVVAVAVSTTLMPMVTLIATIGGLMWANQRRWIPAVACAAAIGGLAVNHATVLDTHGRARVWVFIVDFISQGDSWLAGMGTASGHFFIPFVQRMHGDNGDNHGWLMWLHNDWLQALLEIGAIGLGIYIAVYLAALWNTRRHPYFFACLIGLGTCAFGNYPVHMALQAFCCMLMLVRAYRPIHSSIQL